MTYNELVAYLQNLLQDQAPSADFTQILPAAIQDAEGRIYREMDFLATRRTDSSATFTIGVRELALPSGTLVVQGIAAISPAGSLPSAGTRNTMEPTSLDFIDMIWPVEATVGLPKYAAMKDAATIVVAPTPDAAYKADITGIFRPAALSVSNQNSYIATVYPDIMIAATMVFMAGWQRDFGSQADNPAQAVSWEAHYQSLKTSVYEEEQRRKSSSVGWSSFSQTPLAQPPRT